MLHAVTARSMLAFAALVTGCGSIGGSPDAGPVSAPGATRRAYAGIAAGDAHTCVAREGVVQCWGRNQHGQIGIPPSPRVLRPTIVRGVDDTAQLAARGDLTCAVSREGAVTCWGVLGTWPHPRSASDPVPDSTPRRILGLPAASKVGVGVAHVCALTREGAVYCWGDLEVGGATRSDTPVRVSSRERFVDLAIGEAVSCARTEDERWLCWGRRPDEYGLMKVPGFGSDSRDPVEVPALRGMRELSLGSQHVCGVDALAVLRCSSGFSPSSEVVEVSTSSTLRAPFAACARRRGGEVLCWGGNDLGQTGLRGAALIATPTLVEELHGVTALALGPFHGCALLNDGGVQCFGDNESGQRGTGRRGESDVRPRAVLFDPSTAPAPTPACVTANSPSEEAPSVCELTPHAQGVRLCICARELPGGPDPSAEPRARCWDVDLERGLLTAEAESESVVTKAPSTPARGGIEIRRTRDSVTVCDAAGRCDTVRPPRPSELLTFGDPPALEAAVTSDGARVTFARQDRAHAHEVEETGTLAPFFAETYDLRTHRRLARFFDPTELLWRTGAEEPALVGIGSALQVSTPDNRRRLLDPLTGRLRADVGALSPQAHLAGSRWAYLGGDGTARVLDVETGAVLWDVPPHSAPAPDELLVMSPSRLVLASTAEVRVVDEGRVTRAIALPRCR